MKITIIEKELEQAIETIRTQLTLTVNTFTILVLADITLIGFSINTNCSGIMLIGAILPLIMLIIGRTVKNLMIPIAFTAIYLESEYGDKNDSYLASTFIYFLVNEKIIRQLRDITLLENNDKRLQALKSLNAKFHWTPNGIISILLIIITAGQIITPLLLFFLSDWKFF